MDLLMKNALRWCAQNRPALAAWMTVDRFNPMMHIIVQATWGLKRGPSWVEQNAFFSSEDGAEYYRRIATLMDEHLASLGRSEHRCS